MQRLVGELGAPLDLLGELVDRGTQIVQFTDADRGDAAVVAAAADGGGDGRQCGQRLVDAAGQQGGERRAGHRDQRRAREQRCPTSLRGRGDVVHGYQRGQGPVLADILRDHLVGDIRDPELASGGSECERQDVVELLG